MNRLKRRSNKGTRSDPAISADGMSARIAIVETVRYFSRVLSLFEMNREFFNNWFFFDRGLSSAICVSRWGCHGCS